ncbi:MAG: hypothetical protein DRP66_10055 [Planctomycetota bacterium]|nr:MAG: hypothetical protein DRP66_10055 [Planctomycetota bacterium]
MHKKAYIQKTQERETVERNWLKLVTLVPVLAICTGCEKKTVDLITPDLSNFTFEGERWAYHAGVVARTGEGELHDLWINGEYADFILELEYKIAPGSNSGVYIRCTDKADWMNTALEVQIHETGDGTVHGQCAGVYDCLSPNFIDVARLQATVGDGTTKDLPPTLNKEHKLDDSATVKIIRIYRNYQTIERQGKVIPYEGSDTGWNPALYVSAVIDGTEEKVLLERDKPVKTSTGNCTLNFYSEKRIAEKDVQTPAGQWHSMKISVTGGIIAVWSNGKQVLEMNLDDWTQAGWNPQGTPNKYSVALKDMPRKGFIGLQDHGQAVWFRNIRLTPLD